MNLRGLPGGQLGLLAITNGAEDLRGVLDLQLGEGTAPHQDLHQGGGEKREKIRE